MVIKLTGEGTIDSPYICTKLSEIISVQANTTPYIQIPPNTLIDANEEYPEGFSSAIYMCSHIDGQGSIIRNLANAAGSVFSCDGADFKNLNFYNVLGQSCLFERTNAGSPCVLYNCKFSGRMNNITSLIEHYAGSIRRCSFNFELYGDEGAGFSWWDIYDGFIIEYNRLEFDCQHHTGNSGISIGIVSNCYVTGTNPRSISIGGSTNVVDFTTPSANIDFRANNILVNSDKCASITQQAGTYPVTTAQMKDASYLASLGFPIQT